MAKYGSGLFILVLKDIVIQFREVHEITQRHVESVCDPVKCLCPRIPAPAVNDIVDGGLL